MAQKAWNGRVNVYPSGMIEITGTTESGRHLEIGIGQDEAQILAEAFRINDEMEEGHLGHAYWHARNPESKFPCETCTLK